MPSPKRYLGVPGLDDLIEEALQQDLFDLEIEEDDWIVAACDENPDDAIGPDYYFEDEEDLDFDSFDFYPCDPENQSAFNRQGAADEAENLLDEIYFERGSIQYICGYYQDAVDEFNQAINLNPYNATYYLSRGQSRLMLEDLHGAVDDYIQAIKLEPYNFQAFVMLARLKTLQKKYNDALLAYNQAIILNPNSSNCFYLRGCIKIKLETSREAFIDFNLALDLELRHEANDSICDYVDFSYLADIWAPRKMGKGCLKVRL